MNRNFCSVAIVSLAVALFVAGCNTRPSTPRIGPGPFKFKKVKILKVDTGDAAEMAAVAKVENARLNYRNSLASLRVYYEKSGKLQSAIWATREINNLDKAQEFSWSPQPKLAPVQPVPDQDDQRALVEGVLSSRRSYQTAVDELARYYEKKNMEFKAWMIHTMQERFRTEETYMYLLDVELPPKSLRPMKIIPEANELYDRAWKLHREGAKVPAMADYDKQREALKLLRRLVRIYPESGRVPLAAFLIGEIYKEYFQEHYLAVLWYQRALKWDPTIPRPVRFQTAVQYDFNLGDKAKALKFYKGAIKKEPYFSSNYKYSRQRVRELESQLGKTPRPLGKPVRQPAPTKK